jgi:hypothetical protein
MLQLENLKTPFVVIFKKHFIAVGFFYRKNISCTELIFWGGSPQGINPSTLDLVSPIF